MFGIPLEHGKWGGIGALTAIIGLPLVAFTALTSLIAILPILFPKPDQVSDRMLELHEVSKVDLTKKLKTTPRQFYVVYELVNTGNVAIVPSDFVEPSGLFTPPDNQITNIFSQGSAGLDDMVVDCDWSSTNNRDWFIKPLLLNPRQMTRFTVLLTAAHVWDHHEDFDPDMVIHWRWRIVGLSEVPTTLLPGFSDFEYDWIIKETLAKEGISDGTKHFNLGPHEIGAWDSGVQLNILGRYFFSFSKGHAWALIALGLGFFTINLYILFRTRASSFGPASVTICALVLLIYSFSVSEIIMFAATFPIKSMAYTSYFVLLAYFLTVLGMQWLFRKPRI